MTQGKLKKGFKGILDDSHNLFSKLLLYLPVIERKGTSDKTMSDKGDEKSGEKFCSIRSFKTVNIYTFPTRDVTNSENETIRFSILSNDSSHHLKADYMEQ